MIGSFYGNHGSGAAYVFVHSASGWHQRARLTGPAGRSTVGASVALSAGTAVLGAWGDNGEAGAAFVFTGSGSRWRRQATLADPLLLKEHFGSSVAISGPVAVIGAPLRRREAGASYIYLRSHGRWRPAATLRDPVGHVKDHFGWSVAVSLTSSGTRVLVGAPATKAACGAAYEFVRSGSRWPMRAKVVEPKCGAQDEVGLSVAISGRQALIGAPGKASHAGDVFVLRLP